MSGKRTLILQHHAKLNVTGAIFFLRPGCRLQSSLYRLPSLCCMIPRGILYNVCHALQLLWYFVFSFHLHLSHFFLFRLCKSCLCRSSSHCLYTFSILEGCTCELYVALFLSCFSFQVLAMLKFCVYSK